MGSLSSSKLPVLNLSNEYLKPGTSSWLSTSSKVREALEEYGCFVALYDEMSLKLHNKIFSTAQELFDLPIEIKQKNKSEKPYFGYVGNEPFIPAIYEGMGVDYANTIQGTQNFSNLMWPQGNENFCKTVVSYSKLVSELEKLVKRMVFESYGADKHYDPIIESSTYLLRLMKYRRPEMNEKSLGCEVHTDKSFITILHQNEVTGLEIKTKDGFWIGFDDPTPSSFIVMAGDAFLAWSNGRIHSPVHRVILHGTKERYSLGLFTYNDGIIQVPEELVDDEHPLKFKAFDHFELLRFFLTAEGQNAVCTAKAYCGV